MILFFCANLVGQSESYSQDESEEPDETHFTYTLLEYLFDPLDLYTTDSIELVSRNYPTEAIELIQSWQRAGSTKKGYQNLQKNWSDDYPNLPSISSAKTGLITRQRLQYSPSLEGWRMLHKARVDHKIANLTIIVEQDPGESKVNDHFALSLTSERVPGFDRIVAGHFNIAWGSGLIRDQNRGRVSLNPGSLISKLRVNAIPHYSSREDLYFQGIAGEWQRNGLKGSIFISSRNLTGQMNENQFTEDADGIHLSGKSYHIERVNDAGLAGIYEMGTLDIFIASRYNSLNEQRLKSEFGIHWNFDESHKFQVFINNDRQNEPRSILNWSYSTRSLSMSAQYRRFETLTGLDDAQVLRLLGSGSQSESGLSFRLLVRANKSLTLRYALDRGAAFYLYSLADMRHVSQHKAQIIYHNAQRVWQIDWSQKKEGPIYPTDIWQASNPYLKISKLNISLKEKLTDNFLYRLNFKTASNGEFRSILIQQRVNWQSNPWKISTGFIRFSIPEAALRISVYETGLLESFNFFTAFEDGQRWYIYLRYVTNTQNSVEIQLAQTKLFSGKVGQNLPSMNFQLSIVL